LEDVDGKMDVSTRRGSMYRPENIQKLQGGQAEWRVGKKGVQISEVMIAEEEDELSTYQKKIRDFRNQIRESQTQDMVPTDEAPSRPLLLSSGIPACLHDYYRSRPAPTIRTRELSLNVQIPSKFVILKEGQAGRAKATQDKARRPRVEGGLEGMLDDLHWRAMPLTRGGNKEQVFGYFKGVILLEHGGRRSIMVEKTKKDLLDYAFEASTLREYFKDKSRLPSRVRLRIYVVRGIAVQAQYGPYLEFTAGTHVVNLRSFKKSQLLQPEFWRTEEMDLDLPDKGRLEVSLKDYHDLGDTLIGSTVIDLEDRWFSRQWRDLMYKGAIPTEFRNLTESVTSQRSKGVVEMWIEMCETSRVSEFPPTELEPPKPTEVEVRIVLWGTRNVKLVDGDHVDVCIQCILDCAQYQGRYPVFQETDTHLNSKDGKGVFNWRVVYPRIVVPVEACVVQVKVLDDNQITEKQFIGEVNLDLKKYVEHVERNLETLTFDAELKISNRAEGEEDIGTVILSMDIMTQPEADARKVGIRRDEPNRDPQLITPTEGREWGDLLGSVGLTFNFDLFGSRLKWIAGGAILLLIVIILLYLAFKP